jgi:hypothetical protein
MEKAIESDIRIGNVVHRDEDEVGINEVTVATVQVPVSESTVVDGDVDPRVVVNDGVDGIQVQGEIR